MMKKSIVFVDQLANADPRKVKSEYGEILDRKAAKEFGVRIFEEFSYWAWRACAIANVAMILSTEGKLKENETLYSLICEALLVDGYAYKNRHGAFDVGWKHSVLCKILGKRGIKSNVLRNITLDTVKRFLDKGSYVILSVKSASGGHMVLVKNIADGKIYYNDPYFFKGVGGETVEEFLDSFNKRFLKKGILCC